MTQQDHNQTSPFDEEEADQAYDLWRLETTLREAARTAPSGTESPLLSKALTSLFDGTKI